MAADPRFDFTTLIATYPILTQANASVATSHRFFWAAEPGQQQRSPIPAGLQITKAAAEPGYMAPASGQPGGTW